MPDYDDSNRGALFKNDRKERENQPDYTGSLNVGGRDFWLSAWLQKSKAGKPYMSVSVTPKDEPGQQPATPVDNFEEDIPF